MKKLENTYEDASLIRKVLLGEASEKEQQMLDERLAEHPELNEVYAQLQSSDALKDAFINYQNYSSKQGYQRFLQEIQQKEEPGIHRKEELRREKAWKVRMGWWAAAAVVVLAMGISFYAVNTYQTSKETNERIALIHPGSQQAKLTLPDGSVIDVNQKEISVVVDGVQVNYKQGVLSYQSTVTTQTDKTRHGNTPSSSTQQDSTPAEESLVKSNELVIPQGAENTVILADGTTIHLNAGSRLAYPVRFTGKRRIVTLEGEAYFEVRKDEEHPFVVRTRFGEVTVLGTAFNVNAYNDASACYTTLVNGKVSFSAPEQKAITLLPGEQAVASFKSVEKRAVDVEEYVGWAKGLYAFNDRPLGEIMSTFERWYDVRVYYEIPALRKLMYSGNLKRNGTINTFLDALELTGDIYYKINGRNILIYEND